jgi:hypothetical protein
MPRPYRSSCEFYLIPPLETQIVPCDIQFLPKTL